MLVHRLHLPLKARLFICTTLLATLGACSPAQKKPVIATTIQNTETRHEAFEATLRVLDEHPEYVDEFFAAALRHPHTLDRFLQDTARHLADPQFARLTAGHLGSEPAGLQGVLVATLDEIKDKPAAQAAVAQAIEQRPRETARALYARELAVRKAMNGLLLELDDRPDAAQAFLQAMKDNRDPLADLLAAHPDVLKDLMGALAKRGAQRGKAAIESKLGD